MSEEVICALLRDFRKRGEKAIAQVRRTQPAAYLKICALLVPREMKVEHTNPLKSLSDEQLDQAIEVLRGMIAASAGSAAKVIDGQAVAVEVPKLVLKARRDVEPEASKADETAESSVSPSKSP